MPSSSPTAEPPAGIPLNRPPGTFVPRWGEGQDEEVHSGHPAIRCFGDYELREEIARGGMGVVYKARQVSLNRTVAVKVLLFGQFASDEFVQRFRTEAEAAANLQHANIVAIHEIGEHEGQQYFSMDYVEGGHLGDLVREQPLPGRRAAALLKTIAETLHYAHQHGVLHRDLKPSNILIDPFDEPRVTDFGLAKQLQGDSDLTLTGQMIGTPRYMPPEQAQGRRGDMTVASDIYSLGAILYHLVTGRPPFEADSTEGVLHQVLHHEPVPPRLLNVGVPRDLETICLKCLSKEPRRRYDSAQALADDLQRWLDQEPILARPVSPAEKLWRWCRRKPALATTLATLILVAAAGLAGILWQWRRAEQNADAASQQSIRAEQHAANETAQRLRAEEAVTSLELQRVEDLLAKDDVVMGVAYLARIVRQQPTNRIAGRRLLSALTQRNFALPVGRPLQHARTVNYAEFSSEGRRVVTAALDLTARIWDTRTGEPLTAPMIHLNAVRFAHFSPDGGRLLTFTDDFQAHLWKAATGRALGQPITHTRRIRSAQFSPDGRRVLTASEDGTARVWDAQTGEPAMAPLTHQGLVRSARFSPDGRHIATASQDKTVQVWDAATGLPVLKPLLHPAGVNGVEFSPDGKRVVTAGTDFSTCVWDVTSGQPMTKPLLHARPIDTAKFSPDGERIAVALHNGMTRILNARDWAPLTGPMQHRSWTPSVEFGPEAQRVLTGSHDHTARLWDADSGEPLTASMQHDGMIWSARLSPDGLFAITASADGTARLWDVRLGAARSAPMSGRARVRAAEFSPDGEWVVTAAQDNTARIWNVRTGQQRGPELKHAHWVTAVAFSPDGERVATASSDRTARIWDARTGQPLTEPLRHGAGQDLVSLSPDGRCLATASKAQSRSRSLGSPLYLVSVNTKVSASLPCLP